MATIPEAMAIAHEHHRAGRWAEAREVCRRVLREDENRVEALDLLGILARQEGDHAAAARLISRAIRAGGDTAERYCALGSAHRAANNMREAAVCYRRATELRHGYVEAYGGLGIALAQLGKLEDAAGCFQQAAALDPGCAEAHNNLGLALHRLGRLNEACAALRRAVEVAPAFAEAYNNLGNTLKAGRRFDEGIANFRRALEIRPDFAEAYNNLGNALLDKRKVLEAAAAYRKALALNPNLAEAHNNLGVALLELGKPDEATISTRRALELEPNGPDAYRNLGNILREQARLEEARVCYRRALDMNPADAVAHSNLLSALSFCPGVGTALMIDEHRRWDRECASSLAATIPSHANVRLPERRLRVGYVSPDLRSHPVGRFMLPLLGAHDRRALEVYCYASVRAPDSMTARCRAHADVWRDAATLSDGQLAEVIGRDQIDVLVDLAMHMADNRLLAFARKPAPVQVTYLAYCGTTGLSAMDYRLTDPYLDPMDREMPCYSEQSVWLPETYWCYRPEMEAPGVSALPASAAGRVTFGCLNNFCKASPPALAAWTRVLQAVPGSRLLLHALSGSHRDRVRSCFAEQGVAANRVEFVGLLPTPEYLCVYQQIDIALDPFPYGGGTTTCDALWMGVPVVSLRGETAVGRGGLSILSNIGLPELVARDVDEYVKIAAELAGDLPRLTALRSSLRERMQASPLMDAPRFARNVEAAYRWMWRRWCERGKDEV